MKITITDSAYEDLIDIKEHYKLEGVEHVGDKHVDDIFDHVENLSEHIMHKEYFSVSQETVDAVNATRKRGGRVIAIGTTAVRALESASRSGTLQASCGDTPTWAGPRRPGIRYVEMRWARGTSALALDLMEC
jgi:S-adenosylmethionine:tRNA ribosyltransferase-isomerase